MAASCHDLPGLSIAAGRRRVVLAGNPNVGKSAVFFALTGVYTNVSNFPGTTVDIAGGRLGADAVVDTPGAYGLSPFSEDERVARDVILTADLVINVVDVANLSRDLFLTLQLIDLGLPVVIALNMMDQAEGLGLQVHPEVLGRELGVPVVPMTVVLGRGVAELKAAVALAGAACGCCEAAARAGRLAAEEADQEAVYTERRQRTEALAARVAPAPGRGGGLAAFLGRATVHPVAGPLLLLGALAVLYQVIGVWVAGDLVGVTEGRLMQEYFAPWVQGLARRYLPWDWLQELVAGEFGFFTQTITYLVGLLLPLVVAFYLTVAVLEDSGYLPRIAVLVDGLLTRVGLNGRAVIPVILGFGCVTMATASTRVLGTRRERQIATFLLALAIPCSAQLAVITTMVAPLGPGWLAAFTLIILMLFGLVGAALNRVLPGRSSDLLIDLPPLRLPRPGNVLRKTAQRSWAFLAEAGPIFAIGTLVVAALQLSGLLTVLQGLLRPLTVGWLGLPPEAATAFVMGFIRRDFGAAGLFGLDLTAAQTLTALVVITLFVPCIAALMMITKERGRREGGMIWLAATSLAFVVGGVVYRLLP